MEFTTDDTENTDKNQERLQHCSCFIALYFSPPCFSVVNLYLMIKKSILLCLLAPVLVVAAPQEDVIDLYAKLTEKTVLMPAMLPFINELILSELPQERTNALARIESEFTKRGIAVIHD